MKFYGIQNKRNTEGLFFFITKIKLFCSQYMILNKQKRENRRFIYKNLFIETHDFNNEDLSIPKGKYYKPICILTSDLVLREDIPKLKLGLIRLLKKQYTHKFFGTHQSLDDILNHIENMDDTLTLWYNEIDVGRFDFELDNSLNEFISYFDVYIKNINSSYLSLEFHLYIADNYIKQQSEIIDNNYIDKKGHIKTTFRHNGKTSGGKKSYTVIHYNNENLKSDLIIENTNILKWRFYDKINRYFPTLLHCKNSVPPSINVYKTNIIYTDKTANRFWRSVGIMNYKGQFIDESRKLFFEINQSGRYDNKYRTDLIYIVNEETIKREQSYYSFDFQIVRELEEHLSIHVFKFLLLHSLNNIIAKECICYKSKLNKVKLEKNRLNILLKLRYLFEKDIDFYRRYILDNIWDKASKEISNVFEDRIIKYFYDYRILTESPIVAKDKILDQLRVLRIEFDDKLLILQHLSAYKNENKSRITNYVMLILSAATVVFIIFPELGKMAADFILYIWNFIIKILQSIA